MLVNVYWNNSGQTSFSKLLKKLLGEVPIGNQGMSALEFGDVKNTIFTPAEMFELGCLTLAKYLQHH